MQSQADWELVQNTLLASFGAAYAFYWSLADWKYSGQALGKVTRAAPGTLMMIRRQLMHSTEFTRPSLLEQKAHRDPADRTCHPEASDLCGL